MWPQHGSCDHRCNSRAGSSGVGEPEEEEPDWDLPPDLQEFTGNPGDRKAQLAFKQAQTVSAAAAASLLVCLLLCTVRSSAFL